MHCFLDYTILTHTEQLRLAHQSGHDPHPNFLLRLPSLSRPPSTPIDLPSRTILDSQMRSPRPTFPLYEAMLKFYPKSTILITSSRGIASPIHQRALLYQP